MIENHVAARDERHQGVVGSELVIVLLYGTLSRGHSLALFLPWGLPVGHGGLQLTASSVRSAPAFSSG
jgi:hypothetical protein